MLYSFKVVNKMTSGYSEEWTQDANHAFSNTETIPSSNIAGNSLLLLVIIGLCVAILFVLVILLFHSCIKRSPSVYNSKPKAASLASKSTSITGLNEKDATGTDPANVKLPVDFQSITKSEHLTTKFITSTPTVYSETINQVNTKPVRLSLNEEGYTYNNKHSCSKLADNSKFISPEQINTSTLAPLNQDDESERQDLPLLHTASSKDLFDAKTIVQGLAKHDAGGDNGSNKNIKQNVGNKPEYSELKLSECSNAISEHGMSSLPLDSSGRSRAWFVPLDSSHHAPLRHSFLDTSSSKDCISINDIGNNRIAKQMTPIVDSGTSETCPNNVFNCVADTNVICCDESRQKWPENNLPESQSISSLISHSSTNDCDKKPSAWDKREDRPVVCL